MFNIKDIYKVKKDMKDLEDNVYSKSEVNDALVENKAGIKVEVENEYVNKDPGTIDPDVTVTELTDFSFLGHDGSYANDSKGNLYIYELDRSVSPQVLKFSKYNVSTGEISRLSINPEITPCIPSSSMTFMVCDDVSVYWFNLDEAFRYNIEQDTWSSLNINISEKLSGNQQLRGVSKGDFLYVFNGNPIGTAAKLIKINKETLVTTVVTNAMDSGMSIMANAVIVGDYMYIIGGSNSCWHKPYCSHQDKKILSINIVTGEQVLSDVAVDITYIRSHSVFTKDNLIYVACGENNYEDKNTILVLKPNGELVSVVDRYTFDIIGEDISMFSAITIDNDGNIILIGGGTGYKQSQKNKKIKISKKAYKSSELKASNSVLEGYTGEKGQLVVNTDTNEIHVMDGVNAGGHAIGVSKAEHNALKDIVETKVTKEEGKGLSQENFTTELKTKLEGIAPDKDTLKITPPTEDEVNVFFIEV